MAECLKYVCYAIKKLMKTAVQVAGSGCRIATKTAEGQSLVKQ